MGRRVWETRNGDFRTWPREAKRPLVTDVYLPEQVATDFRIWLGGMAHLEFMRDRGWIRIHELEDGETVEIGGVTVRPFRLSEDYVYAFELTRRRPAAARRDGRAQRVVAAARGEGLRPGGAADGDLRVRPLHRRAADPRGASGAPVRGDLRGDARASSPGSTRTGSCSATSRRWTASPTTSCSGSSSGCRPRARTSASPGTACTIDV